MKKSFLKVSSFQIVAEMSNFVVKCIRKMICELGIVREELIVKTRECRN